jgi:hypothetical protein
MTVKVMMVCGEEIQINVDTNHGAAWCTSHSRSFALVRGDERVRHAGEYAVNPSGLEPKICCTEGLVRVFTRNLRTMLLILLQVRYTCCAFCHCPCFKINIYPLFFLLWSLMTPLKNPCSHFPLYNNFRI